MKVAKVRKIWKEYSPGVSVFIGFIRLIYTVCVGWQFGCGAKYQKKDKKQIKKKKNHPLCHFVHRAKGESYSSPGTQLPAQL